MARKDPQSNDRFIALQHNLPVHRSQSTQFNVRRPRLLNCATFPANYLSVPCRQPCSAAQWCTWPAPLWVVLLTAGSKAPPRLYINRRLSPPLSVATPHSAVHTCTNYQGALLHYNLIALEHAEMQIIVKCKL